MSKDEAIWRVLTTLTGHDRVDEMAADLVSGPHAAGYIIVPWKSRATDLVEIDGKPTAAIFVPPEMQPAGGGAGRSPEPASNHHPMQEQR